MAKFYGDKRISHEVEDGNHYILHFSDGSSARISKRMRDISLTRKSTDLTTLWDTQMGRVAGETLKLWLDWDVKLEQLDHLYNFLK